MRKINKIIKDELSSQVPDIKSKITSNINIKSNVGSEEKHVFNWKLLSSLMCCFIVLCCSIILPFAFKKEDTGGVFGGYNVIIDVNPSIQLVVDENDKVKSQKGLNEDGILLLYKENVVGQNINEATKVIIKMMNEDGFIVDKIKISTKDSNGHNLTTKNTDISNTIKDFLNNSNINVLNLSEKELDDIEDYYDNMDMSNYEKELIDKFRVKLITIVNEKILEATSIINDLNSYLLNPTGVINQELKNKLVNYSKKYQCNLDFNLDKFDIDDVKDLLSELKDSIKDLQDSLKDINDQDDDYNEILEDLFEIVKDELYDEI